MLLSSASRLILRNSTTMRLSARVPKFTASVRFLSSSSDAPPPQPQLRDPIPPAAMNEEIAMGVQRATQMYMRHGIGKQRLDEINADNSLLLIQKWQKMIEAFLGTQIHVLAGLGYAPDENGMGLYNHQLGSWLNNSDPDTQERLRTIGRDVWREVLCTTFGVSVDEIKEVDIVEARNMMHKVSQKMQDESTLKLIAKKCMAIQPETDEQLAIAAKHAAVQDVLVNQVYLGGEPSIVSECGFGEGEEGYVFMQCAMAEHQSDPLVAQYVGSAMMKIMTAAGLDLSGMAPPKDKQS